MRLLEQQAGRGLAGLRIPMRGYEVSHPSHLPAELEVTNPHEGL